MTRRKTCPKCRKFNAYRKIIDEEGRPGCGCVPVVTDRGALPEVMGDASLNVPYGDEKVTVEAIRRALDQDAELGEKPKERILANFSLSRRADEFIRIIGEMSTHE